MIGIKAIGAYVPPHSVNNYERIEELDTNADFIREKIGFESLSRKGSEQETSDLCVEAFIDLQNQVPIHVQNIDCIVVCTQNPDGVGLPQTSSILHHKLGMPSTTAAFDISLGCSGYVYGLNILQSFMVMNGFKNGLLFTADPYSKVLNKEDRNTELLFGDAATCTLLSEDPLYLIQKCRFATDGAGSNAISVDRKTGYLTMSGKDVFMFTMKQVPSQIRQCLSDNGVSEDDIDLFILHQGSKYIIDNLARTLRVPPEKVPFQSAKTGNTVSSSIPLVLKNCLNSGHEFILLSGFGVGLSWASVLLRKKLT